MSVEMGLQELSFWTTTETRRRGGAVTTGYAATATQRNVPCIVTQEKPNWSKREFGVDKKGAYSGIVSDAWPITEKAVVLVTAGAHSGMYLMVMDTRPVIEESEVLLLLVGTRENPTGG